MNKKPSQMKIGKRYKRVEFKKTIYNLMGDKYRTLTNKGSSGHNDIVNLVFQEPGEDPITVSDEFTDLYEEEVSSGGKRKSRHKSRRNQRSKKSRKNHRTTNRRR